jgi:hypothetical protein
MSATYRISRISTDRVDQAYPIANAATPTLSLEAWHTFCRNLESRRTHDGELNDILIASNSFGHIKGVCVTASKHHVDYGRLLDVPLIVVASAADEAGVAAEMFAALKVLARSQGCDNIRVWTPESQGWVRRLPTHGTRAVDHGLLVSVGEDEPIAVSQQH